MSFVVGFTKTASTGMHYYRLPEDHPIHQRMKAKLGDKFNGTFASPVPISSITKYRIQERALSKTADELDKLENDPIWKAAVMPEDHNRAFRHSADAHAELMEEAMAKKKLTRAQAAQRFTAAFKMWHQKNKSHYDPRGLHKKQKTPMEEDFIDHINMTLLKDDKHQIGIPKGLNSRERFIFSRNG